MCVTLAFRATFVSKVRGPPPDVPSPGSLPTTGFSNLVFSPSQPRQPLHDPDPFLHLRPLLGFSAPHPLTPCPLGSESQPQTGPCLSLAQLSLLPHLLG